MKEDKQTVELELLNNLIDEFTETFVDCSLLDCVDDCYTEFLNFLREHKMKYE